MRTLSLCTLLAMSATARAQDSDDDGCIDAYEVGTTCVDVTATIGPDVSFGTDVVVAPRASLGGRASHPSNPLPVGDGVIVGRQATVGVDHILGAGTYIGRSATLGADLTTLPNATVGYAAQVGDDVTLGSGSVTGNWVELGDYTTLGTNAVVARSTTIADATSSGQGTVINGIVGPDTTFSADVRVEQGARVRKRATVLEGARIEATARVGRSSQIGEGATVHGTVGAYAIIGSGATVSQDAVILRAAEVCPDTTVPATVVDEVYPLEGCPSTCLDTGNLIPTMTSNSGPGGVASASTEFNGNYAAFQAFTSSNGSGGNPVSAWSTIGPTGWLQYDFPQATTIARYEVTTSQGNSPFTDGGARDWAFQGSNDGVNWTTLNTQAGITWSGYETKSFHITTPGDYSSYRIDVSANNGRGYLYIATLAMFCE